jgi:hypothetical protein
MMGADRALAANAVEPVSRLAPTGFDHGEMLIDDVTNICQRVPFLEVAPRSLFTAGLVSELADASDRLAAKVADLQEQVR